MAKKKPPEPGITDLDGNPGSPRAPDPLSSSNPSLGSAPTAAEAEKSVEQAEERKAESSDKPEPPKPVVPFRVFKTISGVKLDAMAGFEHHVTREAMKPCTVKEWRTRYTDFMNKPTKPLRG